MSSEPIRKLCDGPPLASQGCGRLPAIVRLCASSGSSGVYYGGPKVPEMKGEEAPLETFC